jgi:ATP-binding cassette subfamily B protein
MDQMFRLLDKHPEISDHPEAVPLIITDGEIRFENVHFAYNDDRKILKGISFTIPAGKKLAVVGHSGSGKSTLARLLYRFYDINSGAITIDGLDIRNVTQSSLRHAIATVPQDTVLFNDTIGYNIAYGRTEASELELIHAAQMANIHNFIKDLPQGYETVVGERGLKLSGGEKQRIAIARAILKQPHILIFDEATSSLDSRSEQAIVESLKTVSEHHTTLVIAHRLSTIVDADQILVLEKGEIIEQGNHQQLIQQQGYYARMWSLQQTEQDKTAIPSNI